jgi:hypothetical protein
MAQQGIGRKCERLRYALGFVPELYAGPPTGGLDRTAKGATGQPRRPSGRRCRRNLTGNGHCDERPAPPPRRRLSAGRLPRALPSGAAEPRSRMLQSSPFRALNKGKSWKGFEKAMRSAAKNPKKDAS